MRRQLRDRLSEREVREGVRHFWAYCTYLDDIFGRLLGRLWRFARQEDDAMHNPYISVGLAPWGPAEAFR